ncbi:MAG: GSCFA domain-containing protein [Muribaculaceae bacterium]|nr:GSCFA domain-containing protein [Muribaculaceae bacterium]
MKFRTEIEAHRGGFAISHDDKIVLLGSCFSDNVGERLRRDGFDVCFNPLGPLYNPLSLAKLLTGLLNGRQYTENDFMIDSAGIYHCLDFASRYQHTDPAALADKLNAEFSQLRESVLAAKVITLTFGSSVVYSLSDSIDSTVGNCHKFPGSMFTRLAVSPAEIERIMSPLLSQLRAMGKNIILTVSPIRHLADGLHGNELSKSRLLLACDAMSSLAEYFPAYEIMLDDLRDYRFYDRDLKHPSEMACDYIYEKFSGRYFSPSTIEKAIKAREASLRAAHRPIIQ